MKTTIEMALETGAILITGDTPSQKSIKAFAELVRADEREAMVTEAAKKGWGMRNDDPFEDCVREIADIRARGETAPTKEIDPNQWAFDNGLEST